jgi:hypothetical protein
MVDSINLPNNLTKVFEVRDTSEPLKRFLVDLLIRVQNLEKENKVQAQQIKDLMGP